MDIANWRRINPGDYPDMPEWMADQWGLLNDHLERLTDALQGQASVANFNMEQRKVLLFNDTPVEVSLNRLKGVALGGVYMGSRTQVDYGTPRIEVVGLGRVRVSVRWAQAPREQQEASFLFFGE